MKVALSALFVSLASAAPYYDPYYDPYGGYASQYGYYPDPYYSGPSPYGNYQAYPPPYPAAPHYNYPHPDPYAQGPYYNNQPYGPSPALGQSQYPQQRPGNFDNRLVNRPNRGQDRQDLGGNNGGLINFNSKAMVTDARKYAQGTRAVADLVDTMKSTATQQSGSSDLLSLFGGTAAGGGQAIGTTLNSISAAIRGTANLMEQGTGTMVKIQNQFAAIGN